MKLITRDTDYALRALCFMGRDNKKIISVVNLVKALKIPRPFLRKIMQVLNKNKVLKSYKGKGGGFLLAKPAQKIFLLDLMEVFQGRLCLNECFFKKMKCPNIKICPLKRKISRIERYVIRELRPVSLASLLRSG